MNALSGSPAAAEALLPGCLDQAGHHASNPKITYTTFIGHDGKQHDLHLDEYDPQLPAMDSFPALLLVHGGGWVGGCRSNNDNMALELAQAGFVVFNMDYRLACKSLPIYLCGYSFPTQPEDVQTAMHWVRANASTYAAWNGKVAAVGTSAGGNLVYLAGDTGNSGDTKPDVMAALSGPAELGFTNCTAPYPWSCQPDNAACDQAYFAPRVQKVCWPNTQAYEDDLPLSGDQTACGDNWAQASPACPPNISSTNPPPPTFIANSIDELVALNEALDFVAALDAHNQTQNELCTVSTNGGHDHGTALVSDTCDPPLGGNVLAQMVSFLLAHTAG
jgi:acetyl esterase/lipase